MAPRPPRAALTVRPAPVPAGSQFGVTGWAPFGHGQHPSDQIGAYAGTVLTQTPAMLPGVQRHCVVEGLRAGWYFPARSAAPNEQQTQRGGAGMGPQRRGQTYTGGIGPISARLMRQRVTASGLDVTASSLPANLTAYAPGE